MRPVIPTPIDPPEEPICKYHDKTTKGSDTDEIVSKRVTCETIISDFKFRVSRGGLTEIVPS